MYYEEERALELEDDPLAEPPQPDHPAPLRLPDRWIDGAQEERAGQPHLLQRAIEHPFPDRLDVDDHVRQLGHDGIGFYRTGRETRRGRANCPPPFLRFLS